MRYDFVGRLLPMPDILHIFFIIPYFITFIVDPTSIYITEDRYWNKKEVLNLSRKIFSYFFS